MSYNIGDPGPAGGFIFATPQTPGNNTGFYFEAGPVDIAISQMPPGGYGINCSSGNTWQPLPDPGITAGLPQISGAAEFGWMKAVIPTIVAIPSVSTATGADVGDGKNNTVNLLNPPPNVQAIFYQSAAELCDNYSTIGVDPVSGDGPIDYKDWFLPSEREATLMMNNIGPNTQYNQAVKLLGPGVIANNITYPNTNKYWTSTADHTGGLVKAKIIDSLTGITTNATRCHVYSVRPVRMFMYENYEREYRCPGDAGGSQCISVPLGSTLSPLNAFQTLQDCNTALQNGDCGGGPSPCIPNEADCYNYRDGVGGVNLKWTPRLTPIYTPGLSGSGAHSTDLDFDNMGHDYRIKTTWVDQNGITHTNDPLTAEEWIKKFFQADFNAWISGNNPGFLEVKSNQRWDSVIGLPWFNLNISQQDAMGNEIDISQFKAQNGSGYLIKIWDKRKRLLGSWLYDNCQVMHPTVKYYKSATPGSSFRNEIDMQCNNFPELCKSKKLRVFFTCNGGKLPQMIDGHHEHGKFYRIIQYGYRLRSQYLGDDLNYPSHHGQVTTLPAHWNGNHNDDGHISTPTHPGLLSTDGINNSGTLGLNMVVNDFSNQYFPGVIIPSFGHRNEDYGDDIEVNPNILTNSYAYILIKCDYFDNSPQGYAHINGPNTDEFHMNIICDETHGAWAGQNLYDIPFHGPTCGPSTNFNPTPFSNNIPTGPYITGSKYKQVINNCRNHGMIGNRAILHAGHGTNTTGPNPLVTYGQQTYPPGCINGDPTNPCLHQSFSSINFHPWFAQFKPGDGSVPGTNSTWTNITWYNSTHDFIYDNQATPTQEPNMLCRHLTWAGTNATGGGTESEPGGRGQDGEYVITEFNINENHITEDGSIKQLSVVGDAFATFSLTITTNDATVKYYNFSSDTFSTTYNKLSFEKLNASGLYQKNIIFPASTSNVVYSIRLQAEPHFDTELQLNSVLSKISHTKKIYQYAKKKITFTSSSETSSSVLTFPTDVEVDSSPSLVTIDNKKVKSNVNANSGVEKSLSWTYSVGKDKRIIIKRQPLITDFESKGTQIVNGVVDVSDANDGKIVTLYSVENLLVGDTITGVSSGSIIGSPVITAIDFTNKKITIDVGQNFAPDITLTFTNTGVGATRRFSNTEYSLNNLKATLNNLTTTVTSDVSNSVTVPVNSISGITPKALEKTVNNTFISTTKIAFNDNVDDLAIGQTLVEGKNLAGQSIVGAPTIVKILEADNAVILSSPQTFRQGTKLTFASTFVESSSIDVNNRPYVERIEGSSIILSSSQNFTQGQTLTFTGSSNSVTITANIVLKSIGENDVTATLKLDNILKIS